MAFAVSGPPPGHSHVIAVPMDQGPERATEQTPEGEVRESVQPIRCRACEAEVADADAVCSIDGASPVQVQGNPLGAVFEVVTLCEVRGLAFHGPATQAFSWFAGYAWTVASCARCSTHLGWRFDAVADGSPSRFWGLIVPRVTGLGR